MEDNGKKGDKLIEMFQETDPLSVSSPDTLHYEKKFYGWNQFYVLIVYFQR